MPRMYSPEFRRKVLDLLDAGRRVAEVASDLGVTQQTIYNWRRQHLIGSGQGESGQYISLPPNATRCFARPFLRH